MEDKEFKKMIKRANQRILEIERRYGVDIWGIKDIKKHLDIEPLQAWTKSGRISYKKTYSEIQQRAIEKAVKRFLKSNKSSLKGIERIKEKQIKGIKESLEDDLPEDFLDEREEFELYEYLNDKDFIDITKKDTVSDMILLFEDARYKKVTLKKFLDLINPYVDDDLINDLDAKERITRLYNKFVKYKK